MSDSSTVIAAQTVLSGRVVGGGELKVEGRLSGHVELDGPMHIAAMGRVEANCWVQALEISGIFVGEAVAGEWILIQPGARVVGKLAAPQIVVYEGALVRAELESEGSGLPEALLREQSGANLSAKSSRGAFGSSRATQPVRRTESPAAARRVESARRPEPARESRPQPQPTRPQPQPTRSQPSASAAEAVQAKPSTPAAEAVQAKPSTPAAQAAQAQPSAPAAQAAQAQPSAPAAQAAQAQPSAPAKAEVFEVEDRSPTDLMPAVVLVDALAEEGQKTPEESQAVTAKSGKSKGKRGHGREG